MQTIDFIHPEDAATSQDEIRRIIISNMVKKRNSIVPVIGKDTYSFDVPLVVPLFSCRTLKWTRYASEESSKVMHEYTLTNNRPIFSSR